MKKKRNKDNDHGDEMNDPLEIYIICKNNNNLYECEYMCVNVVLSKREKIGVDSLLNNPI